MDYDKQSINVDEQVALLQNRGLVIEERACVIGKLENEWHLRGSPHRPHLGARAQCLHHLHSGFEKEDLCQQARSRHRAFGLQDHGYADGGIHRCRRQPVSFLLQAASAPGKQPVRYRERKSGRANHGSIGLHQRHDGYLCLRYLSEDQRNKSADSIETKQAFLIFLRKSVLNKER